MCCVYYTPIKKEGAQSSRCDSAVMNLTSIHEEAGLIPGLTRGVKGLVLLWLWSRPAATALIRPLAAGAALKSKKKEREGREGREGMEGREGRKEEKKNCSKGKPLQPCSELL